MPFFAPHVTTEHDALASFLEQQAEQLRLTALDLTDDQASRTHEPSALSIAGLLAHSAQVIASWLERARIAPAQLDMAGLTALGDELGLQGYFSGGEVPEVPLAKVLEAYDRATARIRPTIEAADLDAPVPVPDAPWYPEGMAPWNTRWVFFHLVTEIARHAGHADLIREAIDGEIAYSLNAKADGEEFDWAAYRGER